MSIFYPSFYIDKVDKISISTLKKLNIRGIILDIDDTLVPHKSSTPNEKIILWIKSIQQNNVKLILVSNNFKKRVESFAKLLNLPYISFGIKPFSHGFKKAIHELGIPKSEIIIVGDQIFTDVLGANFLGIKSILVDPVSKSKTFMLKLKRFLEIPIKNKILKNKKIHLN
ncbi:MAG: YqeG family HAD IIIA-type phosphatase [Acutalibacteraceae bacterium]